MIYYKPLTQTLFITNGQFIYSYNYYNSWKEGIKDIPFTSPYRVELLFNRSRGLVVPFIGLTKVLYEL